MAGEGARERDRELWGGWSHACWDSSYQTSQVTHHTPGLHMGELGAGGAGGQGGGGNAERSPVAPLHCIAESNHCMHTCVGTCMPTR